MYKNTHMGEGLAYTSINVPNIFFLFAMLIYYRWRCSNYQIFIMFTSRQFCTQWVAWHLVKFITTLSSKLWRCLVER